MSMGEKIKELRIKAGLTQEELGNKLGIQKSAVAKYENGRVSNIKRTTIAKMCEIFGVTSSYLMDMEEETYYDREEVAAYVQELFEHPELRLLFDAAKDVKKEDLRAVVLLLERLKRDGH